MKTSLGKMTRNEAGAKDFLLKTGILHGLQPCMLCGSTRVTPVGRGRTRCSDCGFTWGLRRGSIIENTRLTYLQFIRIARLFADEIPPDEAAERLHIGISPVEHLYHRIRLFFADGVAVPGTLKDPVNPKARPGPVIFGIHYSPETIRIEPLAPGTSDLIVDLDIPWSLRGNILFIDTCEKSFHGLIAYYPDRENQEVVLFQPKNRTHWPPLTVFWKYAQTSWSRHRYLKRDAVPAYIQELAFRYNHRHKDMFHAILEHLSGYEQPA
ncbi:MAG: hypothetical protein LUQ66_07770 [Methanoregula sp.]|nr:hypothetical protein [Methanoregula sp.]